MVVDCIDQGRAGVRSGCAGDALRRIKRPRRGNRVTLLDPKGRLFKALGHRLTPLVLRPASRRDAILAQGLEKTVQPVTISQTGSNPLLSFHLPEVFDRPQVSRSDRGRPSTAVLAFRFQ